MVYNLMIYRNKCSTPTSSASSAPISDGLPAKLFEISKTLFLSDPNKIPTTLFNQINSRLEMVAKIEIVKKAIFMHLIFCEFSYIWEWENTIISLQKILLRKKQQFLYKIKFTKYYNLLEIKLNLETKNEKNFFLLGD
ncbi:hypothetical protein BpHYR1_007797 [Brachionus plicatilis]|uniref:Uncharacterized protein n=1 Tax=Brachionus plicatilis TaxID=10195 RepID=A0A3M7PQJ8_BRAPC|nr:hypothetical protein BpHYR1_007797 [Brachionus plicatilis]